MPTSAYMDRNNPKVPQLQASFINHLVQPLYIAYEKAGIVPGEWLDVEDEDEHDGDKSDLKILNEQPSSKEAGDQGGENVSGDGDDEDEKNELDTTTATDTEEKKKYIYCVMSENIKKNYKKWLRIIAEEKEEEEEDVKEDEEQEEQNKTSENPQNESESKSDDT